MVSVTLKAHVFAVATSGAQRAMSATPTTAPRHVCLVPAARRVARLVVAPRGALVVLATPTTIPVFVIPLSVAQPVLTQPSLVALALPCSLVLVVNL